MSKKKFAQVIKIRGTLAVGEVRVTDKVKLGWVGKYQIINTYPKTVNVEVNNTVVTLTQRWAMRNSHNTLILAEYTAEGFGVLEIWKCPR